MWCFMIHPFFREVLNRHFFDDVCIGKTRSDALKPVSSESPNFGIGDTLVRINGTLFGTNCDLTGFSHPAALVCDGMRSFIKPLRKGEQIDGENILANSPLLVMDGKFAIPDMDWGLNRWYRPCLWGCLSFLILVQEPLVEFGDWAGRKARVLHGHCVCGFRWI